MKLSAVDLNLLLAFDVLAAEGSVTKAAARLGISQPAMSGALARLRLQFNDPLFVRTQGQMRPTPRARQLLGPIGSAVATLRETLEPTVAFRPEQSTHAFAISATDYVESLVLGKLISALRAEAPHVSVRTLRPTLAFAVPEAALLAGDVDLALGLFAALMRPPLDLFTTVLYRDRFVALVRPRHPRVSSKLTLKTFLAIPQIRLTYSRDSRLGLVDTALASRGVERDVALTVANLSSIPAIVARSDLLGMAPERLAREWARSRPLRILDLPISLPDLPMTMVWHRRRHGDPAHAWLREVVTRELGEKGEA